MNVSSIVKKSPLIKRVEKISETAKTRNHLFKDTLEISKEAMDKAFKKSKE